MLASVAAIVVIMLHCAPVSADDEQVCKFFEQQCSAPSEVNYAHGLPANQCYEAGLRAFSISNFKLALAYFLRAQTSTNDAKTWYYQGLCFMKLRNYECAYIAFDGARAKDTSGKVSPLAEAWIADLSRNHQVSVQTAKRRLQPETASQPGAQPVRSPQAVRPRGFVPPNVLPLPPFRRDAQGRECWFDRDPRNNEQRLAWRMYSNPQGDIEKMWASRLTDEIVDALRPKLILHFPFGEAAANQAALNTLAGYPNIGYGSQAPTISYPVDWGR